MVLGTTFREEVGDVKVEVEGLSSLSGRCIHG